jgi:hypothetical protein
LRPSELVSAAEDRGIRVDTGQLEALHQRGLLVPLFEIRDRASKALAPAIVHEPSGAVHDSDVVATFVAARESRLADPQGHRFRPWPGEERAVLLYSMYQVISLHRVMRFVELMTRKRLGEHSYRWALEPISIDAQLAAERGRRLAIGLEALDVRYRPDIVGQLTGDWKVWNRTHLEGDASEQLQFLGVEPDALIDQADNLLLTARHFDPLDGWIELVRNARYSAWKKLRGDARLALDYRIAAELLLRLHDELTGDGVVESPPLTNQKWWQPRDGRLRARPGELDATLLNLGLSPHPALVVGVEGPTESLLLPRVLELGGLDPRSHWIEIVDLQGGKTGVGALARHVVHPRLDEERADYITLRRPLSHLAIVVDPDSPYASDDTKRTAIVDHALLALPIERRTAATRELLDQLISVHTWPEQLGPFEYAHFSDAELTDAIAEAAPRGLRVSSEELGRRVAAQRASPNKNIEHAFVRAAPGLSKPGLAEALWPALRRHIEDAETEADEPPILRISIELRELARIARRANAVAL